MLSQLLSACTDLGRMYTHTGACTTTTPLPAQQACNTTSLSNRSLHTLHDTESADFYEFFFSIVILKHFQIYY